MSVHDVDYPRCKYNQKMSGCKVEEIICPEGTRQPILEKKYLKMKMKMKQKKRHFAIYYAKDYLRRRT
jgi:hypothetical protein